MAHSSQLTPGVSLCMIVRDSAKTLGSCLESIRPWVDELIVVDTGSVDKTRELAASFGAIVSEFPWIDDFSAARNASLERASHEWLFWMDSDDTIDAENGQRLRALVDGSHEPSTLGYVMQVHCPAAEPGDFTVVDHVKLIRNHPALRFEGRIHEQVLADIRRLGGETAWTDIHVVHSGSDNSQEGRKRKCERDLRILEQDLAERPDHPFVLFNFGMTHSDMEEHEQAVSYLMRCLEVSDPGESHVRKAFAILVTSLSGLGEREQAEEICRRGRELFPTDPELLFREGMLAHDAGRLEEAVLAYEQVLYGEDDRHFTSIDRGIVGYKARHNLALVFSDLGRPDLAEVQWRRVLQERPYYRAGCRALGEALLLQQRSATITVEVERLLEQTETRCDGLVLRAKQALSQGEKAFAEEKLKTATQEWPDDVEAWQAMARFRFDHGPLDETEEALLQLLRLRPDDGSVHHNLGTVAIQRGAIEKAVTHFEDSLAVRPDWPETERQLLAAREQLKLAAT